MCDFIFYRARLSFLFCVPWKICSLIARFVFQAPFACLHTFFPSLSLLLFWFIYQPSGKCFLFARTHSRLTFTLRCCFVSLNEWIFVWVFVMYVIRNRFHFIKCTARFLRTSVLRSLFKMSLLSHPHIAFQISNCNCEYYSKCLTIDNSHESNCFTIYRLSMFSL